MIMKKYYVQYIKLYCLLVLQLLSCRTAQCTSKQYLNSQVITHNLPQQNWYFIGRQNLLNQINNMFMMQHENIVAIAGGPGLGKTQLAKKYAFDYCNDYDLSWWFDARQDIHNQYKQLSISLNNLLPDDARIDPVSFSKESLVDKVKQLIMSHNLKVLLIFDNTSNFDDIKKFIPHSSNGLVNVLITSRNQDIWSKVIKIDKFDRPESVKLIQNHLPKITVAEAEGFAKMLGDYPLELAVAISTVKNFPRTEIDDYMTNYLKNSTPCRKKDVNMTNNAPNLDGYDSDICKAVQISLDYLAIHHPKSLELLYIMSVLNSKDIPHAYIEQWIALNHKNANALNIIKPLIDQSLVDINTAIKLTDNKYTYSMHDLVHKVVRDLIPSKDKPHIIDQAAQILLGILPRRSDLLVEKLISEPIHLQHAERILKEAKRIGHISQNLLTLMVRIFCFSMDGARDFDKAKLIHDDIERIFINHKLQLDPYDHAMFMVHKGYFLAMYAPDYSSSLKYTMQALKTFQIYDKLFEEKLFTTTDIAQDFILKGLHEKGKDWLDKGEALYKKSSSSVYNIFYLHACQLLLINKADYVNALKVVKDAKKFIPLVHHYPIMQFAVLDQEVELLLKMKKFDDALVHNKALYEKISKFFQDRENSYQARNLLYNAWIIMETQQNYAQAITDINQSIEMANRIFHGPDMHILQPLQHTILGRALEGQQKYAQALAEYQFAEHIYKKILEQLNGMDDVSLLYQYLVQISLKLNNFEQAKQYLRTHIDLFGPDHPRSKEMGAAITNQEK